MSALLALSFAALEALGIPDGTYRQNCQAGYRREEIIAGGEATYVEKNFSDPLCKTISLEIRSYGEIEYGGGVPVPPGAVEVDFQFSRVMLVPKQEWVAELYRDRKLCGFGDWAVEVETNITGRSCDFFGVGRFSPVPEAGDARYGIYRLEKDGTLYFGKLRPERDGRTPERRPRELDPFPYIRE